MSVYTTRLCRCCFPISMLLFDVVYYVHLTETFVFTIVNVFFFFFFHRVCVSRCAPGFLGEYCQHKDPCQPGYCLNGGSCAVSMSTGIPVPGSATCTCPLGFTGAHCQTPQNSTCYPNNPCRHKGVCTLLPFDKFKCDCSRGWTGGMLALSPQMCQKGSGDEHQIVLFLKRPE